MVRRTRRSRNSRSLKHLVRTINRVDTGHQLRRGPDPPAYLVMPWWPVTVEMTNDTTTTYSAIDVLKSVSLQTGIKPNRLLAKIDSVRVWGTSDSIQLNVYGLIGEGNICNICDRATKINFAHAGWKFGAVHRNVVFSGDESVKSYETIATVIGKGIVRFHCYFRVKDVVPSKVVYPLSISQDECKTSVSPISDEFAHLSLSA